MSGRDILMNHDVEMVRVGKSHQLRFFEINPRDTCRDIGLNWLSALQLYKQNLLSFDPSTVNELDEAQEAELRFVGSLVTAGCGETMIMNLFRGLKKPYQYNSNRIYYHWASQQWRLLPMIEDTDEEQFFQDWIDELVENNDEEQLAAIESIVSEAIGQFNIDKENSQ